jgi:putative transposase
MLRPQVVRYRRNFLQGGTFFFTVTLEDRRASWLTSHIAVLREALRAARAARPFQIGAMVVLPDHLHCIFTLPDGDTAYPQRWQHIKRHFTGALVRSGVELPCRDKTGRVLWQRRYWEHTIRDDEDYRRHVDYIHYNPVKHGLVANPVDWPHSSLHRFIREGIFPPAP